MQHEHGLVFQAVSASGHTVHGRVATAPSHLGHREVWSPQPCAALHKTTRSSFQHSSGSQPLPSGGPSYLGVWGAAVDIKAPAHPARWVPEWGRTESSSLSNSFKLLGRGSEQSRA